MDRFYAAVRLVVRFWLWFCFKPVDVRHPERVPAAGPVLLCINHPNNLIDSLVVAAALRRKWTFLRSAAATTRESIRLFGWLMQRSTGPSADRKSVV